MVQPHRACSSGATSHHAPGTQDASANKNKPRHSAYSDATIVRLIINRTTPSEWRKERGWTEDCDHPQRKPADVWEMACDWEHQFVGVSSSPGKLQRSLPAPSPNNKSSPAVGIIFYSFIHSIINLFILPAPYCRLLSRHNSYFHLHDCINYSTSAVSRCRSRFPRRKAHITTLTKAGDGTHTHSLGTSLINVRYQLDTRRGPLVENLLLYCVCFHFAGVFFFLSFSFLFFFFLFNEI